MMGSARTSAILSQLDLLYAYVQKELKHRDPEQTHLTHNHPLSDVACLCIGAMVQAALLGADRFELHAMTRDLVKDYPTFRFNNYRGRPLVTWWRRSGRYFITFSPPAVSRNTWNGVVNQGGDADTTGAIAGMLAGACYGSEALPASWPRDLPKFCGKPDPNLFDRYNLYEVIPMFEAVVDGYNRQPGSGCFQRIEENFDNLPTFIDTCEMFYFLGYATGQFP